MFYGSSMMGVWGFALPLLGLLIFVGFLVLVFRQIGGTGERRYPPTDAGPESESALEILDKRYARGEINKKEYEEIKKDLMSGY
ncbi:MAG: SHOCT domain-containing protein [Anaerolineae bacterium]|nr:SHOCT domain-containing protein [Anaerolineae bacterium]